MLRFFDYFLTNLLLSVSKSKFHFTVVYYLMSTEFLRNLLNSAILLKLNAKNHFNDLLSYSSQLLASLNNNIINKKWSIEPYFISTTIANVLPLAAMSEKVVYELGGRDRRRRRRFVFRHRLRDVFTVHKMCGMS